MCPANVPISFCMRTPQIRQELLAHCAALPQRLHKLGDEPVLVSDFDGEPVALWQFLQKGSEAGEEVIHAEEHLFVEIPELEKQRPELLPERLHHLHELRHVIIAIHEHLLMRDDLWDFRSED